MFGQVMCVWMWNACVNAREQMNERVTVIEGDRMVIWLARRIPRWVVLEDYHNGWTFEISTIARASTLWFFSLRRKIFKIMSISLYHKRAF